MLNSLSKYFIGFFGVKWLRIKSFPFGLEICQLLHITNGTFDFIDIGFSVFFWLAAYIFVETNDREENIAKSIGMKTASCLASYSIVYLAHVIH